MAYKTKKYVSSSVRRADKEDSGTPSHFLNRKARRKRAKELRLQRSIAKEREVLDNVFSVTTG